MKDAFDKEIKVGDNVIYASRHSSSLYLSRGVVLEVGQHYAKIEVTESTGWYKVPRTVRCVAQHNLVVT